MPRHSTRLINLVGNKFSRLTVLSHAGKKGREHCWLCQCECGKTKVIFGHNLKRGLTTSCGCRHKEIVTTSNGETYSPEWAAWYHMIHRCTNKANKQFRHYGGRGISVCQRWLGSFENFLEDMGRRPSPLHTIDRYPDNNGNYEPGNCRWATMKEQGRNRRSNRLIVINGQEKTISEWAESSGIPWSTIYNRINRGWKLSRLLEKPRSSSFSR